MAQKQIDDLYLYSIQSFGVVKADKIYVSIKNTIQSLTYFPGLGYVEPTLADYPQCFRTFVQHPNIKIVYWVEDNIVKIAMLFDTRQQPYKLRHTIEHGSDWVCEEIVPYGLTNL
ncbi:MAG: hypothetical protein LUD46_11670 [Parabacteroides sp.]|nr:hypothetical protein [Parabacteroides sp.]